VPQPKRSPQGLPHRMLYRIVDRMKVTAILPDDLVTQVRRHSGGKNVTEALQIALQEWLAARRIKQLNRGIAKRPLQFRSGYTASDVREANRRR
jgi:hypothetical protein